MPDDLTNRGPQDRSRISLLEPHEVQYWADKFNVSKERLSEAVRECRARCGCGGKGIKETRLAARGLFPASILAKDLLG